MNFDTFLKILIAIGIPSIIGGAIYIGRKLQILDDLATAVKKVKNNIKVIADFLVKSPIEFDHTKLESYSPLRVSEEGRKWLEEIDFIKIFNEHSQDFFALVGSENPITKYDVEISATKSFLILSDREYFKPIKTYLYNHPKENLHSMSKIAGIYIRDKYLEKHLKITQ